MSDELKKALAAIATREPTKFVYDAAPAAPAPTLLERAFDQMTAAPAPEPVAWAEIGEDATGTPKIVAVHLTDNAVKHGWRMLPLYAHPAPVDAPHARMHHLLAALRAAVEQLGASERMFMQLAKDQRERAERAERDAKRYRWLRDQSWKHDSWSAKYCVVAKRGDGLDAAIDAAMREGK